jgi:hypothetical protein
VSSTVSCISPPEALDLAPKLKVCSR